MKFKQFKQSQKFRVIVKGVSVYVTAKQIRWGFGDQLTTNAAVHAAFHSLTNMKAAGEPAVGLAATYCGLDVQIDML
jgi:hypothetical protein